MKKHLHLSVYKSHEELEKKEKEFWKSQTPEERLDALELIRIQAGKFLYDAYPTRLRRVIRITREV